MDLNKKPFKLVSQDRRNKKGVVAGSLEELIVKGSYLKTFENVCLNKKLCNL